MTHQYLVTFEPNSDIFLKLLKLSSHYSKLQETTMFIETGLNFEELVSKIDEEKGDYFIINLNDPRERFIRISTGEDVERYLT